MRKYFNLYKGDHISEIRNKYVENESKYVFTNAYSILLLKKIENDCSLSDNKVFDSVINYVRDFENYQDYGTRLDAVKLEEDKIIVKEKDKKYGVDAKSFNIILDIIKPTKISVLNKWYFDWEYIIKFENQDTEEIAYLLPTRTF